MVKEDLDQAAGRRYFRHVMVSVTKKAEERAPGRDASARPN